MAHLKEGRHSGSFRIGPDRDIYGELSLDGERVNLDVHDRENFDLSTVNNQTIHGTLHDLQKVSLINCVSSPFPGEKRSVQERYYFANIASQYAVAGVQHITADDAVISDVRFSIDDATTLFYDFDAFRFVFDAKTLIEDVVAFQSEKLNREIEIGPHPRIACYTGKRTIFEADTKLGKVSAVHSPGMQLGGPSGAGIPNKIFINLHYEEEVRLQKAIDDTFTLLMFLGLLIGRPQNVDTLALQATSDEEMPKIFNVYCGFFPRHERYEEGSKPHPNDILIDSIKKPNTFSEIITNWIDKHEGWHEARARFSDSFAFQISYDIDRIIRSANLFDILPDSAYPLKVELSDDLEKARDCCKKIFKALPDSPQRDTVLGALGRIGSQFLRTKIRHRAGIITRKIGDRLPDLFDVVDEAVKCRNRFVHGTDSKIDYTTAGQARIFLTNTLEFVFAASDLIEAGWDIKTWSDAGGKVAHPFGRYIYHYRERLQALKDLQS